MYKKPEMTLEMFDIEDVITASSGGEDPQKEPDLTPSPFEMLIIGV